MNVLLLSLLLVSAAAGGHNAEAGVADTEGMMAPHFSSASEVMVYWQTVLPHSPMPTAISQHLSHTSAGGGEARWPFLRWARPKTEQGETRWPFLHWAPPGTEDLDTRWPFFPEDALTPGSTVAPHFLPAASGTGSSPFLRRAVADSIRMSTDNFTDIAAMFPPASLSMARDMWSTLDACEHPRMVKAEQQACATSIESMVELAAAVLGTRHLRAFSSTPAAAVPEEGLASGYEVVSTRRIVPGTAEDVGESMPCHGMAFPYAVFYCHAVNPTRVYHVTLRPRVEDDGGVPPSLLWALAVCHLDTSDFDPANPFFVESGLKPGDAPVCHFISRDTVLWAPAADPAKQHVRHGHTTPQ